jgi:exodeoxyribonuclease V alpha subunit
LRPSGNQLAQWLADNIDCIGNVKAQRLYDLLGDKLCDAPDAVDHESIEPVSTAEHIRETLFGKWLDSGDDANLKFVQERCIPLPQAR